MRAATSREDSVTQPWSELPENFDLGATKKQLPPRDGGHGRQVSTRDNKRTYRHEKGMGNSYSLSRFIATHWRIKCIEQSALRALAGGVRTQWRKNPSEVGERPCQTTESRIWSCTAFLAATLNTGATVGQWAAPQSGSRAGTRAEASSSDAIANPVAGPPCVIRRRKMCAGTAEDPEVWSVIGSRVGPPSERLSTGRTVAQGVGPMTEPRAEKSPAGESLAAWIKNQNGCRGEPSHRGTPADRWVWLVAVSQHGFRAETTDEGTGAGQGVGPWTENRHGPQAERSDGGMGGCPETAEAALSQRGAWGGQVGSGAAVPQDELTSRCRRCEGSCGFGRSTSSHPRIDRGRSRSRWWALLEMA
eukprot:RCo008400